MEDNLAIINRIIEWHQNIRRHVKLVGESITGNDCIEQAKQFNDNVGIDGIILSKADVDEKGGAAISISYVTSKPILFLGTGQKYESLTEFDKDIITKSLGLTKSL